MERMVLMAAMVLMAQTVVMGRPELITDPSSADIWLQQTLSTFICHAEQALGSLSELPASTECLESESDSLDRTKKEKPSP
jgi:hypothetical protein